MIKIPLEYSQHVALVTKGCKWISSIPTVLDVLDMGNIACDYVSALCDICKVPRVLITNGTK